MKKETCNHHVQPVIAVSGRLIATLFWISLCHSSSNKNSLLVESAPHLYTDSFPNNDEYDFTILDPNHLYGSPYGGFGRATPSRIAALPLKLPNVAVDLENYEEFRIYVETRDYLGRRFVCRTYHEDELESESLEDSMYDTVQLREDTPTPTPTEETITETETNEVDSATANQAETTAGETGTTDETSSDECAATPQASAEVAVGSEDVPEGSDTVNSFVGGINDNIVNNINNNQLVTATSPEILKVKLVAEVNRRLGKLDGICAQIHEGWWSYEWCHQNLIVQFHVHVGNDATRLSEIKLLDETTLGKWSRRQIQVTKDSPFFDSFSNAGDDALDPEDGSLASSDPMVGSEETTTNSQDTAVLNMIATSKPKAKPRANKYSEGTPELAVVSDTYSNGDICPETGKPRTTQVDLRCCSPRVMNRIKGGVLFNGKPIKNDLVAIHSLSEQPGTVCVYNVTVCTPLLCSDKESQMSLFGNAGGLSGTSSGTSTSSRSERAISALGVANVNVEHMSVREMLDLTFGNALNTCIQSNTGGWWIYEICPGSLVRQFHETTLMDRVSGAASTAVDTEHILGKYNADDHESYPNESEWQHVVNATVLGGGTIPSLPTAYGGNGAYFYQEYTGGDVCDHTDVTEAAIKAGAVGEGGVERASTVRYSCGTRMSLNVKEDSTCHYLVEVTIPALCGHPLFRPPLSKRQILKCLPAEDSLGTIEEWYA